MATAGPASGSSLPVGHDGAVNTEAAALLPAPPWTDAIVMGSDGEPVQPPPAGSCIAYLRSVGPGLVMALTWLGAGDLVDSAVAGGDYGYALTWALPLSFAVRFIFASILAKFQLCNVEGLSLPEGLLRLHPVAAWGVATIVVFFAHFNDSYMIRGVGEASAALAGVGPPWAWACGWMGALAVLVVGGAGSKRAYRQVEQLFSLCLGLLSSCLIGTAVWVGPDT